MSRAELIERLREIERKFPLREPSGRYVEREALNLLEELIHELDRERLCSLGAGGER